MEFCVHFDCVSWYFWFVWDVLQVFIKFVLETGQGASCLAMDIYWKAVEKLWTPNVKAPFSDCPNFTNEWIQLNQLVISSKY